MKEWASRFAEQLLKDNLQLEEFQVSLLGYNHFDEIVDRLRELGCNVEVDQNRKRLIVTCPHNDPAPGAGHPGEREDSLPASADGKGDAMAVTPSLHLALSNVANALTDAAHTFFLPTLKSTR